MRIPELITVQPNEEKVLNSLSRMIGTSFLEEVWFATWLEALDALGTTRERKEALMQAIIYIDYELTAPYGCCLTLPDHAGAINVFLSSKINLATWQKIKEESDQRTMALFSPLEQEAIAKRERTLHDASDTDWMFGLEKESAEFLYIMSIGIDTKRRGTGAFGSLFKPLLAFADEHKIKVYLDCYTERLEQLYGHYGFEVVDRKTCNEFDLVERCMVRRPVA